METRKGKERKGRDSALDQKKKKSNMNMKKETLNKTNKNKNKKRTKTLCHTEEEGINSSHYWATKVRVQG